MYGRRFEIIEGELYVSKQPSFEHQYTCVQLGYFLVDWDRQHELGVTIATPGLIFAEDDDVAPDLVWMSHERLFPALDQAGHLHAAPELVVEVLSPGKANEDRDRQAKLKLYSRRGVQEYWIVDWMQRQVEVHRRKRGRLLLAATLYAPDTLESSLLPGFSCHIAALTSAASTHPSRPSSRLISTSISQRSVSHH